MKNTLRTGWFLLILLIFLASPILRGEAKEGVDKNALMKKVSGLQVPFIENQGQIKPVLSKAEGAESVRFYANTFAGTVFITDKGEIVYSLIKSEPKEDARYKMQDAGTSENNSTFQTPDSITKAVALRERLVYSNQRPDDRACLPDRQAQNTDKIKGLNKSETKVNYFIGDKENWRTNIPTWQEVSLGEVYKGIELKLKAYGKNVEKIFTVNPKGSVEDIKLKLKGAKTLRINDNGELEVETELGAVKYTKPVAYQEIDGKRMEVAVEYRILKSEDKKLGRWEDEKLKSAASQPLNLSTSKFQDSQPIYGFQVAQYDKTKPLIIDPTLVYSTYLGGSGTTDYGQGIVVDSSGNMYVSGTTNSTDFPTASPIQGSNGGGLDIFVAKINASGSTLLYSTYIGGSLNDSGCGNIALDSSGNAYITGYTYSTDFPTTASPLQGSLAGDRDAFITKIDASGSALLYSTYLGGSGYDYPCGWEIAVDSSGNAYISGETNSTDFPTVSPIQASNAGGYDAFVSKINASGSALLYSTYLGGSGTDAAWAITIDSSGNAYISGYTSSTNFPTASPIQASNGGNYDAFVTKINASGSTLLYSTYLGGSSFEEGYCIAVDSSGNAYVTGKTDSTNFPTASPIQASNAGGRDAYVAKINAAGSALVYSTYLGGSGYDVGWGITVDSSGAYIAGQTSSTNFPTVSPVQASNGGGAYDAFVTKINAAGSAFLYSTYLGGSNVDYAWDIAIDSSKSAYVIGRTNSANFPTVSPIQASNAGGYDAFVAKIELPKVDLYISSASVSVPSSASPGDTITVGATVSKSGSDSAAASTARIYIYGNVYGTGNKFLQIGDVAVAAFGTGSGSQAISTSVTIPSWVVPGSHQIIVRADLNNDVPEWNESNNRGYKAITIVP